MAIANDSLERIADAFVTKTGKLRLHGAGPGKSLAEARGDSDVQTDREIWV